MPDLRDIPGPRSRRRRAMVGDVQLWIPVTVASLIDREFFVYSSTTAAKRVFTLESSPATWEKTHPSR